jgi:hypothetical protein
MPSPWKWRGKGENENENKNKNKNKNNLVSKFHFVCLSEPLNSYCLIEPSTAPLDNIKCTTLGRHRP